MRAWGRMAATVGLSVAGTLLLATSPTATPTSWADEGQWAPRQIAELDLAKLRRMGLELPPRAIHDEEHGGGLLSAVLNYSGCTAAFVSAQGLILTNHHCAYSDLQSQSTPEHDYLSDGFLAKTRGEELRTKGRGKMQVLDRVTDVTKEIRRAMQGVADDRKRQLAIEAKQKELVAACEAEAPHHRCRVASFYEGSEYQLHRSLELRDIRIVYAPPAAVGEYGGDIDNWMWPRHTGDFTMLRAYVGADGKPADYDTENVPYHPPRHLRVSPTGVSAGDFVMIMGYPGNTKRHLPAVEIERQIAQVLPSRAKLYATMVELLEREAQRDKAVAIKVASTRKSAANREKNARGMLEGIARMGLLERRRERDEHLAALAESDAAHRGTMKAVAELSARRRAAYPRSFLLSNLRRGANLLALASDLVRRARERDKPDLERASRFMDRNEGRLKRNMARRLRNFDAEVEAKMIAAFVGMADGVAIPAFDRLRSEGGDDLVEHLRELLAKSKLADQATIDRLYAGDLAAVEASDDPILTIARELVPTIEETEAEDEAIDGAAAIVGPRWFRLLRAEHAGPLYPDANGTLRFSYATVEGYEPRDGLYAYPHTTLRGAMAKHRGEAPFDLPEGIRKAAPTAGESYWAPADLGDVPICYLANGDTTGGNSGSPAVNGRGELVGLNFDRVWENIAGDFGYNPPLSRNIMVDVRYVLFLLDRVDDAGGLLEELGVASFRKRSAPSAWEPQPRPPATNPVGCAWLRAPPENRFPAWLGLGLATLAACRRRSSRRHNRHEPDNDSGELDH